LEYQANNLIAENVFVRKFIERYRPNQLAEPLGDFAAQVNIFAGVITFPCVAVNRPSYMEPLPRDGQFHRNERILGTNTVLAPINIPGLERLDHPRLSGVQQASLEEFPRRLLVRAVLPNEPARCLLVEVVR
jgi:hypothetical protein